MKRLTLIRHATAGHSAQDRDRPLTPDGLAEAADIARQFLPLITAPSVILASPARRTTETARALHATLGDDAVYKQVSALYLAEDNEILDVVAQETDAAHIIVVAHNPGIGQLALTLGDAHDDFMRGFAPATIAHFECSIQDWADLRAEQAQLIRVITPAAV